MLNGVSINNTDVKQGVIIGMLDIGVTARIEYSAVVIKSSCSGNITNHAYAIYHYILPSGTSGEGITEKVSATVTSNNALFRQISIDYLGKIPPCKPCICIVETVATNIGTLSYLCYRYDEGNLIRWAAADRKKADRARKPLRGNYLHGERYMRANAVYNI